MKLEHWAERNARIRRLAQTPRADLALRYFDIRAATVIDNANWQPFQIEWMNETALRLIALKARQIGASFILAGDELFDGLIKGNHTVIMTSYNLEEAKEKILYARQWWDAKHPRPYEVPLAEEFDEHGNHRGVSPNRIMRWPELIKDNTLELLFENGFRMISHPSRPPRGKKASVALDEFAHAQHAAAIFTAAQPMMTRGRGQCRIRIPSTPLGAQGKFWEIFSNVDQYKHFKRVEYGWWEIEELCPPQFRVQCREAWRQGIPSEVLVPQYATPFFVEQWETTLPEDFEQEFAIKFLDAIYAYLSWDLIKSCYPDYWRGERRTEKEDADDFELRLADEYKDFYVGFTGRKLDQCLDAIMQIADAYQSGLIKGTLVWAYDVGRERDPACLVLYEIKDKHFYQRLILMLPQTSFEDQESIIAQLMHALPITRGLIDMTGMGQDLSERLEKRFGWDRASGVWFTPEAKEMWAVSLKRCMERHLVTLIPHKEQELHLHSVQRKATSAKHMQYVVQETVSTIGGVKIKHHADLFWANALAIHLCEELLKGGIVAPKNDSDNERIASPTTSAVLSRGFGGSVLSSREAMSRLRGKMGGGRR